MRVKGERGWWAETKVRTRTEEEIGGEGPREVGGGEGGQERRLG